MKTVADRIATAQAALAAGFRSEAARNDALDTLNRGASAVEDVVRNYLLSIAQTSRDETWGKLYYSFPSLHNWKARHAAAYAAYPDEVRLMEHLSGLRAAIKAAALTREDKAVKKAAAIAKAQADGAMTCQICDRSILANSGVVAHHGYTRPGNGWQTGSCPGARELPFEVDRMALFAYIGMCQRRHDTIGLLIQQTEAETIAVPWVYIDYTADRDRMGDYPKVLASVTRGTFEEVNADYVAKRRYRPATEPTFESKKEGRIKELAAELASLTDYIAHQQARFDGWTKTHSRIDGKWEATK